MRFLIVVAVFILFTFLFYKAAGTLSVKKLNMISFSYYLILIFAFIGASCVFCGFRNHYLIQKVSEAAIDKTYLILSYTIIMLPLTIWVCNVLFRVKNMKKEYTFFLEKETLWQGTSQSMFVTVVVLTAVCLGSMVYVFWMMGYFPPLAFLTKTADELNFMRIQDTRGFAGNSYIRDLVMCSLTPLVSYIAYIYMRKTKEAKWLILFAVLFVASVIVKTYNFEKAPVVYYIIYLYILEVLMGNIKSLKAIALVGVVGGAAVFFFYYVISGYSGELFTISSGPGGRIFMTQIATLFLHVDAFPNVHPFLNGASLPTLFTDFLGMPDSWVRSGGIVMNIYNQTAVSQGIAGVMNSIFAAEAWANWGTTGVAIAPVIVGAIYSASTCFIVKAKKSPAMLVIYLILFINFTGALLGGFVDYLYPLMTIVFALIFYGLELIGNKGRIAFKPGGVSPVWLDCINQDVKTEGK
ncbi:MAG: hypothetical protein IKM39_02230 [Clostridia bacterium]|nr:hypothetical protein [Clostridia bacterium]